MVLGRGSGAGSIVAYAVEITDIDPIKYNLLFERFLNPERISMPDFDVDFSDTKREQVIDYVSKKYGHDHVSQIITFGTMSARMVIRDVGRVLDYPYADTDRLAKMIPNEIHITISKAMTQNRELKELYETDETIRNLLNISMALEGMPRQASTHACRNCYNKRSSRHICAFVCKRWKYIYTVHNDNIRGTRTFKNGFLRSSYTYSNRRCIRTCERIKRNRIGI